MKNDNQVENANNKTNEDEESDKENSFDENKEDNKQNEDQPNEYDRVISQNAKKFSKAPQCCKFCLGEENEENNPLINPCNCSGSMKYIHVLCLKNWMKSKITTRNFKFLIVYCFKNIHCELCKANIPDKVKLNGEIINLFDLTKPDTNYIILESISREKSENKYLYIIHLKESKTIKTCKKLINIIIYLY